MTTAALNRMRDQYRLSPRELDVFQLFLAGCTGKEIAFRLERSQQTVSEHKAGVMAKTNQRNDVELIKFGIRQGLISA
jgi:DNA-binding NarL/FixJ family response regulator